MRRRSAAAATNNRFLDAFSVAICLCRASMRELSVIAA
jgi:hypothetical protein